MFLIFLQFFLGFLWVRVSIIVLVVSSFAPWFEPPDFKFSKNCPDPNEPFHYALPLIAISKSRISNCIIAGCIHLISLWLSLFTLSVFVCFSGFFGFLWVLRVWALLGSRSDTLYLQTIYFAGWRSRHPGDRYPIFWWSFRMACWQVGYDCLRSLDDGRLFLSTLTPSHPSLTTSWIESRLSLLFDSWSIRIFR